MSRSSFAAVVVAAGSGARAGGTAKQLRLLRGRPVVRWSVEALAAAGAAAIVVVIRPEDQAAMDQALEGMPVRFARGGETRADSVRAGLAPLSGARADAMLIHDAARPLLSPAHVEALLSALIDADGALLALPVADTLKRGGETVEATQPRAGLWRAQTPQAFRRDALERAYAALLPDAEPTDDAAVLEAAGGRVRLVPGDPRLMKITYPKDFAMVEALAGGSREVRTGFGLDAHRFEEGEGLRLCGVPVPYRLKLKGHSDADVGLHALTDALLGAAGLGDIGDWFPPTDPQWRGADSGVFLQHAARMIAERGGRVVNVDVTLVCERPRVKPHREAMRTRVAELLGLPVEKVSVKATTTEGMGFTGREEGIAAQAVASVEFPA